MKERPILFSGPMVKALLAGTKTQTRRLVKPGKFELPATSGYAYNGHALVGRDDFGVSVFPLPCPYGLAGDRLWVRETHAFDVALGGQVNVLYRATDPEMGNAPEHWVDVPECDREWLARQIVQPHGIPAWRPSIYTKRWASRLTLEVTEVRAQRLQEITNADALAEGTPCWVCGRPIDGLSEANCACFHSNDALDSFESLWDEINGERSPWASNPWVWVVGFHRIEQP